MPWKQKTVEDFNKIFKSEIPTLNSSALKKISETAYKFSTNSSFQPNSSNLPNGVSSNKFYNIFETHSKATQPVANIKVPPVNNSKANNNPTPVNNSKANNNPTPINNPPPVNNSKANNNPTPVNPVVNNPAPVKELTPHEKFMKKFGKTVKPAKRGPWHPGKTRGGKRSRRHRRTRRK